MVSTADKAAEEARKSAYDECHKGAFGRGSKCGILEEKRDAKLKDVERLQHAKDLTDRASGIEAELTGLRKQHDDRRDEPRARRRRDGRLCRLPG